jgi:sulfotransferase
MKNGIHFISGLPRSGSTLLAALLLQNPTLHAGITSGVGSLVGTILRKSVRVTRPR